MDDIQFSVFLQMVTDLNQKQIEKIFDIFDLDRSGAVEFDEVFKKTHDSFFYCLPS